MKLEALEKLSLGKKLGLLSIAFIALIIILANINTSSDPLPSKSVSVVTPPAPAPTTAAESKDRLDRDSYLRLGGTSNNPDDIMLLASTEDEFGKLSDALHKRDSLGILELPGVFGVGSGTKVLVLDSGILKSKVRIMSTIRDIDTDKFGRSGWVNSEWVVDK